MSSPSLLHVDFAGALPTGEIALAGVIEGPFLKAGQIGTPSESTEAPFEVKVISTGFDDPQQNPRRQAVMIQLLKGDVAALQGAVVRFAGE